MEKHINLSDFFKGDALTRIRTYIKSLQNYIDEYDLIVLMARKAICFFEALVRNEEVNISNSKCRITTNRIFTYNITQFDGEKILLMDDIVVKGRTIRNTIKEAEKFNKNFKIYFLANKKNNNADMVKLLQDSRLLTNPSELSEKDILTLSNSISNYITASMCSLNIDYPIFKASITKDEFLIAKSKLSSYKIGNNIQDCFDLDVSVQSIISSNCLKLFNFVDTDEVIMKVRFFYDEHKDGFNLSMIPIILFGKLSSDIVNKIFQNCSSPSIEKMINNALYQMENKFKWVQYYLSYKLFWQLVYKTDFLLKNEITYDIKRQNWIFPYEYEREILNELCKSYNFPLIEIEAPSYNSFDIADVYARFHEYLTQIHIDDPDHSKIVISYDDVFANCKSDNIDNEAYSKVLSIIFDIAIDKGLIVPFTVFDKEKDIVFRAYRLSEQFELTIKHQEFFIKMLSYFAHLCNTSNLEKTVVEKLMVIFFNKIVRNEAREDNSSTGSNLFSVHYTRFGPVVSSGDKIYEVEEGNELTCKVASIGLELKKLKYNWNLNKYDIPNIEAIKLDKDWDEKAYFFGEEYYTLYSLIQKIINKSTNIKRFDSTYKKIDNGRIRSFGKYLVLKAIGNKQEDKYLSLLAELQLFKNCYKNGSIIDAFVNSLSGLISGAWKYLCYQENSLDNFEKTLISYFDFVKEEINALEKDIQNIQKWIIFSKSMIGDSLPSKGIFNTDDRKSRYYYLKRISEALKKSITFEFKNESELRQVERQIYNEYLILLYERLSEKQNRQSEYQLILGHETKCRRALSSENDTENKQTQNKLKEHLEFAAALICKLLQCWNITKTVFASEYKNYKANFISRNNGKESWAEINPDDMNLNYISDLKKYTNTSNIKVENADDIIKLINEICNYTSFLTSEYDLCIKDDLKVYPIKRLCVFYDIRGNKQDIFRTIKLANNDIEKFLNIEEDEFACAFELDEENEKLCSQLITKSHITCLVFDLKIPYNICYLNSNGKGVTNEFLEIYNNAFNNLKKLGGVYYISDYNSNVSGQKIEFSKTDITISKVSEIIMNDSNKLGTKKNTDKNLIKDINLAIITALEEEFIAIKRLLNNVTVYTDRKLFGNAGNRYYIGEINAKDGGVHKVVLTMLPQMGNDFATAITTKLQIAFPSVRNIIVCGIAGCVPIYYEKDKPIRIQLGDIVVATHGVIEYDFGADKEDGFICKEQPSECSSYLSEAVKYFKTEIYENGLEWYKLIDKINENCQIDFSKPQKEGYHYEKDNNNEYKRCKTPISLHPTIHYGKIGSGNAVEKSHINRDKLASQHNIIAIEMESGGVNHATKLNNNGYLAIRGICDYCDKNKNDEWHNYAAAYVYSLIESMPTIIK